MKKLLSLLLIVAMLFSVNSVAFAADYSQAELGLLEVYTVDTGVYYRYGAFHDGEEWIAIVFMPNNGRNISFSATPLVPPAAEEQEKQDDRIYTISIASSANKGSADYLQEGFASLQEASVISASFFDTIESANEAPLRDSVQRDLFAAMRQIYGNEYERVVYRNLTYPNINEIDVHQDLVFRMHREGSRTFGVGTALSVAALALTRLTGISVAISFLALIVSVSGEYINASATVDAYIVEADFGRWTTIDDGDYVYTMTNKIYTHCGLNERNNETAAYLQNDNPTPEYIPSSTYYNSYSAQAADAYAMYLQMN